MAANTKHSLLVTSSADSTHKLIRYGGEGLVEVWRTKLEEVPTAVEWLAENRFISGNSRKHKLGVYEAERGELGW